MDRRFNRRKYNTAKTIEAYSTRLHNEIDLDTLSTALLAVGDPKTARRTDNRSCRVPKLQPEIENRSAGRKCAKDLNSKNDECLLRSPRHPCNREPRHQPYF
jgi:hypothetical protein